MSGEATGRSFPKSDPRLFLCLQGLTVSIFYILFPMVQGRHSSSGKITKSFQPDIRHQKPPALFPYRNSKKKEHPRTLRQSAGIPSRFPQAALVLKAGRSPRPVLHASATTDTAGQLCPPVPLHPVPPVLGSPCMGKRLPILCTEDRSPLPGCGRSSVPHALCRDIP